MKDLEHSLLQKAVRRGAVDVVEKTVNYLLSQDDAKWLSSRLSVMVYEECWTMGNQITQGNILEQYITLSSSVKNKDVAGLATLATSLQEGDKNALRGNIEQRNAIISVKNTLDNDKPMMFAAAYLRAKKIVPRTAHTQPQNNPNFPYWIAFDKHTEMGKFVISEACKKININPYVGMSLSFYLEGSLCNQMTISPYWQLAREWKMNQLKMTFTEANIIWNQLKPIIIELAKDKAKDLQERIEKSTVTDHGDQLILI